MKNLIFIIIFFIFFGLIAVQSAMLFPEGKAFINPSQVSEGLPIEKDQYLYNRGFIRLRITDEVKDKDINISINGVQKQFVTGEWVVLPVVEGDVLGFFSKVSAVKTVEIQYLSDIKSYSEPIKNYQIESGQSYPIMIGQGDFKILS
jgi:hypothetical protein